MIAYVDSSVILRFVLDQPNALASWADIRTAIASRLVEVECLRTLDRLRLRRSVSEAELSARFELLRKALARIEFVHLSPAVLARASQPFPTSLRTLDAIHLSTALLWREQTGVELTLATHDGALALAGRAFGLAVVGA